MQIGKQAVYAAGHFVRTDVALVYVVLLNYTAATVQTRQLLANVQCKLSHIDILLLSL